jgi:hypothetical protein
MAERGILLFGQRNISIPSAQASALERSLQSYFTVGAQRGRQQLQPLKALPLSDQPRRYHHLSRWTDADDEVTEEEDTEVDIDV